MEDYQGWHTPLPDEPARPSHWPAMLAFSIMLVLLGPVTSMFLTLVGFVLGAFALAGWIGDMAHE